VGSSPIASTTKLLVRTVSASLSDD
jgi:hypothetical protein